MDVGSTHLYIILINLLTWSAIDFTPKSISLLLRIGSISKLAKVFMFTMTSE